MPCYLTGSAEGDALLAVEEAHEEATKMADMLCRVLTRYEMIRPQLSFRSLMEEHSDIAEWWVLHKKIDTKRKSKKGK